MADTPMIQQYKEIKSKHQDKILFFRLGDFYEMFFEDARIASKALEITLTSRGKQEGENIPMCGVPYHSADGYIQKLVEAGLSVAICEQMEDPQASKGIVKRDIIKIITPGTFQEDTQGEQKSSKYLLSLSVEKGICFLAYMDIGIGNIRYTSFSLDASKLMDEILRIKPIEIISYEKEILKSLDLTLFYAVNIPDLGSYEEEFSEIKPQIYEYGTQNEVHSPAVLLLLQYIVATQKSDFSFVNHMSFYEIEHFMSLDYNSVRNLELFETMRTKEKKGSLYWLLDKTKTAMGRRLLKDWIAHPLINVSDILYRQSIISYFIEERMEADSLMMAIDVIYDLDRLAAKSALLSANPKDYEGLKNSIANIPQVVEMLQSSSQLQIQRLGQEMDVLSDVFEYLKMRIKENPPHILKDGGFIIPSCDETLHAYDEAICHGKDWLMDLEEREKVKTQIKNLKVKYNKVFGYHIEVSKGQLDKVPAHYIRKQTIANGERYITEELKVMEDKIITAKNNAVQRENEIYDELRLFIKENVPRIRKTAKIIAQIDVYLSLAKVAYQQNYIKPIFNEKNHIEIKQGRHPVVEVLLKESVFVANDLLLDNDAQRFLIITGPNMSGKSTYLRQTALIVLMAQIGSFVPASKANLFIVDKIFTRVGASDDLGSGQSTFMLEMSEMAYILKNYTAKSLIIADEIGRGTSTYDGLSIAWAIVEYIVAIKGEGKTLFATHYQELTELESKLKGVSNYKILVLEQEGSIKFLRKIEKGSADKSYGIEVAKLAGIPKEIIERAHLILSNLESQDAIKEYHLNAKEGQLSLIPEQEETLISKTKIENAKLKNHPIFEKIKNFDLLNATPLESMAFINELKQRINDREKEKNG